MDVRGENREAAAGSGAKNARGAYVIARKRR